MAGSKGSHQAYRRGSVLGLTVAEVSLLFVFIILLMGTSIYCPPCDFDCKLSASEVVRWSGGLVE